MQLQLCTSLTSLLEELHGNDVGETKGIESLVARKARVEVLGGIKERDGLGLLSHHGDASGARNAGREGRSDGESGKGNDDAEHGWENEFYELIGENSRNKSDRGGAGATTGTIVYRTHQRERVERERLSLQ